MKPIRTAAALAATCLLVGGCGATTSGAAGQRSRQAVETLAQRFSAAAPAALRSAGLTVPADARIVNKRMNLGVDTAHEFHAYSFPVAGLSASSYSYPVRISSHPNKQVVLTLYELPVPKAVSICESPWYYGSPTQYSCRVEGFRDGTRAAIATLPGLLELHVVSRSWALDVSAATLGKGNSTSGVPPLSPAQTSAIAGQITDALSDTQSAAAPVWSFTSPRGDLKLTLPAVWDARSGGETGTVNLTNTATGDTLFLSTASEASHNTNGFPCTILRSTPLTIAGRPYVIRTDMVDARPMLGKVLLTTTLMGNDGAPIPCGTQTGVRSGTTFEVLQISLEPRTPAQAAAIVGSSGFAAMVKVMASAQIG